MIAYFDCFSGLAGDMIVSALVDAGLDAEAFLAELKKLPLTELHAEFQTVQRSGIAAKLFVVHDGSDAGHTHGHSHHHGRQEDTHKHGPDHRHASRECSHGHGHAAGAHRDRPHAHRGLAEIVRLISDSPLADRVKRRAVAVFERIGSAEAKVHGVDIQAIHFHEVGAVDSIADIVGACIALEMLGIDDILFPTVPTGSGSIRVAHGVMPVPAPATAELLKGFRSTVGPIADELTTPTGAAIVTALGRQVAGPPEFIIGRIGYGAGTRVYDNMPNVLRVLIADSAQVDAAVPIGVQSDRVTQLACQIDDMTGEQVGYLTQRLLAEGALDVIVVPIYMKKQRPAVQVEVLADSARLNAVVETLLRHSSTFGVRRQTVDRLTLRRDVKTITLPSGETVRVKLGYRGEALIRIAPEFDDCRAVADCTNRPLIDIMHDVVAATRQVLNVSDKNEN